MAELTQESSVVARSLRALNYNATVTKFVFVHDQLAILRIKPDAGPLALEPGRYTVLGLGFWEPRIPDSQDELLSSKEYSKIARRAYSISCSLLDDAGKIVTVTQGQELEFYIALVMHANNHAPALTPRLFMLEEGDRLYVSRKCHGRYTLGNIQPSDNIVFLATGTGEAPHNAMIAELFARQHRGQIASVVCTRYQKDLAYLVKHRRLEQMRANYRYLTLTTREKQNVDANHSQFVGRRYLQDYFESRKMEIDAQFEFDPSNTHIFLCGNPAMIGVPNPPKSQERYPTPVGMIELLERRGFQLDRPRHPGNIHFENYW